ncbi:MAG TPA: carboxypeptidase regulatory-like domain-containing protein [Vicinamibacterales bacterium]|jgi:hypothetical protein|nr:carboxypeptidase regulatory-like domain-containing protein [Vicinamibacterales bacterium]
MARYSPLKVAALLLASCLALPPAVALAQTPTGTIGGRVTDSQGRVIPGVVVTISSPSLQGEQTVTTTENGDYLFKLLPPGTYALSFEKTSFTAATEARVVGAGEPVTVDVTLQPAAVREAVTVTASGGDFVNTIEGATNLKQSFVSTLPVLRNLTSIVNLAPAVHATGPNGNFSISGGMSFENSYMVNGVQVQDNLRGEPLDLYIEDAIQETTVLTSGISAEYGRFTGGIVNVLTKSGGNRFSGSFRESFANDNWRTVSPFDEPKVDKTVPTTEFTLGGPIVKDRLWFFGAGRFFDSETARQTGYTDTPYVFEENQKRFEGKLTHSPHAGQRVELSYVGISDKFRNAAWPSSADVMDLASLTNPSEPQSLFGLHYTGTFGGKLFVEGQFSARKFTFEHSGGLNTDLIAGTPLSDNLTGAWWWAPNFCGVCPDERRDNTDLVLKGSYFLSSASGSHDLSFGYDGFNDKTFADNHQSASDWHVWTTTSFIQDGTVYPVIDPGGSTYIINWPVQPASHGTNFRTHSLFVNDKWAYGRHWSFNLGLRYDKNSGRDQSGTLVVKDSLLSPRLGASWDPKGDGSTTIRASYGRYVAAVNNGIAGSTAAAGTPGIVAYFYDGDPINDGGPLVTSDEALRQVFDWYNAVQPDPFQIDVPGVSSKIADDLRSPHADEVVVGLSQQIGRRTSVRVDFVNRVFGDFYADRVDTGTGLVFDDFGTPYDLKIIENTNDVSRRYRALTAAATYGPVRGVSVGGNYTLSRLWGNDDGESLSTGPLANDILSYPEYFQRAWAFPDGNLGADQRHRARLWATWDLPWARSAGAMSIGVLQQIESGTPYGAIGAIDVLPYVADYGYVTPPFPMTYYFTARDAFHTEALKRTDLSFTFSRRVGAASGPELFGQVQLLNLFNQFQAIDGQFINTTVHTAFDSESLAPFDPFAEAPVEGVNWSKGTKFGDPISKNAYTTPRTFRFSVGVRF